MILLALAALATMSDTQIAAARKAAPADVRAVVDRWEMCNHWGGEEAYDKARARQIERASARLRCDRLDRDEALLRHRYVHRPAILRLLTAAHDIY